MTEVTSMVNERLIVRPAASEGRNAYTKLVKTCPVCLTDVVSLIRRIDGVPTPFRFALTDGAPP